MSATVGILAGSAAGRRLSRRALFRRCTCLPSLILVVAASVVFGASVARHRRSTCAKKPTNRPAASLLALQLKQADNLIYKFPGRAGALDLSIRADQKIDQLEFVQESGRATRTRTSRFAFEGSSTKFNPIDLKQLFVALKPAARFRSPDPAATRMTSSSATCPALPPSASSPATMRRA